MAYNFHKSLLVEDLDIVVNYFANRPQLALTNAASELKAADLVALNEVTNFKASTWATPRSRQKEYPVLNFLFGMLTTARIFLIKHDTKGYTLSPNTERLEKFRLLTDTEKYFFLLETFWCYCPWSALEPDDRGLWSTHLFTVKLKQILDAPTDQPLKIMRQSGWYFNDDKHLIDGFVSNISVEIMQMFDWIDPKEVQLTKKGNRYDGKYDGFQVTTWGRKILPILLKNPYANWNKQADSPHLLIEDDEIKVDYIKFLSNFFKISSETALESMYPINVNAQKGAFQFRLSLPNHKFTALISLSANDTLEDLHDLIQEAVAFDNDHLFAFYFNLKDIFNGLKYEDPRMKDSGHTDGPYADEVTIAELDLYEGQRFLYLFDFGDNWEFLLILEKHLPEAITPKTAILETKGKKPKQYYWN